MTNRPNRLQFTSLDHDYRLGIVTNGYPESQAQRLSTIGIRDAFDVVICAGYDTPSKLNPEPFHQAVSALNSTPDSAIYVGDDLGSDVAGAQTAGLQAVWFADGTDLDFEPNPTPDYIVNSIKELKKQPWH